MNINLGVLQGAGLTAAMESITTANNQYKKQLSEEERRTEKAEEYLKGNVFCFTGKMIRPRVEIMQELHILGGRATYNWEAGVTILVKVDEHWKSTKIDKATKKNIPVITEDQFWKLMNVIKKHIHSTR